MASSFFAFLLFVGVFLASCTGYAINKLYDRLPIHMYLGLPLLTVSCIVIAVVHTGMDGT